MPDPKKKKVVKRKNRVTAVKNADGTTTKTRVRRDGSVKKVKTYKGKKTVASKVVKYRKDGSVKKTLTRPGDKSGTIVTKKNKKGQVTAKYNRKKRIKDTATTLAKVGLGTAATISSGAIVPIGKAAAYGGTAILAGAAASEVNRKLQKLRKVKPIKSMQNAANWMKKGIKNKIQTGNRKGKTKK
jgi:hypothetical protein